MIETMRLVGGNLFTRPTDTKKMLYFRRIAKSPNPQPLNLPVRPITLPRIIYWSHFAIPLSGKEGVAKVEDLARDKVFLMLLGSNSDYDPD
jgi:hypothetical protein